MGTRNLTCVVLDGKYKVAQYGQWDGDPGGQGVTIVEFFSEERKGGFDMEAFREKVRKCRFATDEEIEATWAEVPGYQKDESGSVSMAVANHHSRVHPELSRDTGAEILDLVYRSKDGLVLADRLAFAGDSLFCEWAYVIDLDAGKLEVYRGFNSTPLAPDERFAKSPGLVDTTAKGYYPVRFVKAFDLAALPDVAAFCADPAFRDEDEEDEEETSAEGTVSVDR